MSDRLRTAHTHELTPATRQLLRAALDDFFEGDFSDEDWEHGLGGVHAYVEDAGGRIVAHGSVVMRRVVHAGRAHRVGYVEGVGVRDDRRRQGLGHRVMEALEGVVDRAYDFGALSASDEGALLYRSRGWHLWRGTVEGYGPHGTVHLPDEEGSTFLRPAAGRRLPAPEDGPLLFDWRDGDVL
ncbi:MULTISPECIES: GNAT family N-acetyltransferase [Streptomyces]|uniref:Aminoglycoside 2'-N-acetyltransferase n=2 Tax=Streptomyces TaxID=1883 RepID=A0A117IW41_9ACTN|nr:MULTISPECIES: GNAT family N-acetyltransferase [Streptomyces]KUH38435.1 aminoglycoside 2'-N-acetyltransferase [Streptomyces kanasensis]UUS33107.1 GNAT family N-acetyltransferase [Streptomyces changanensis]